MTDDRPTDRPTYRRAGSDGMPIGLPAPFTEDLGSAMARAAAAMNAGDPSALVALKARLAEVEEENRRLRASGGGRRPARNVAGEAEDEENDEERRDRETLSMYEASREAVMSALAAGRAPTGDEYAERDLHMYRLAGKSVQPASRPVSWLARQPGS